MFSIVKGKGTLRYGNETRKIHAGDAAGRPARWRQFPCSLTTESR